MLATHPRRPGRHPLRNDPPAQGRHADSDLADRLADSRRRRAASSARRRSPATSATASRRTSPCRRLAAVVESSDDAIVTKNLDGIITSWNPAAERMFGYTAAEAIGQSIRMLIPAELQGEEDTVLAKIRAGEAIDHYETIRQRKDGTDLSISLTVSPIRERRRRGRRRLEDRARHHRAGAPAGSWPREHAANTAKLGRGRGARRVDARPRRHRPEGDRHRDGADPRGVRRVLLQRPRRRVGRRLHAVHAVGRAEGSVREVSAAARDRDLRADVPRRGDGAAGRRDRRIRATARTRRTTACRPGTCRCAATWRCRSRACRGDVLGGLFFGHSQAGVFTEQHERLAEGMAGVGLGRARERPAATSRRATPTG